MRIITGTARGRRLKTLEGTDVRPTADAVKEAIFSAIQFEIEGKTVLDLFAGSGQMGIEALSRGAARVSFADSSPAAVAVVRENLAGTGFADKAEVSLISSGAFLKKTKHSFDIAILDPPYERKLLQKTLPELLPKMKPDGIIVCEHEKGCALPDELPGFPLKKTYRHGKTGITIYRANTEIDEENT